MVITGAFVPEAFFKKFIMASPFPTSESIKANFSRTILRRWSIRFSSGRKKNSKRSLNFSWIRSGSVLISSQSSASFLSKFVKLSFTLSKPCFILESCSPRALPMDSFKLPKCSLKEFPRLENQELTLDLKLSIVVLQEEKKEESLSVIRVMPDVRSSKRTLSLSAIRSGILRIESIREE